MPPEGMGKARGNCGFLGVFTSLSKGKTAMDLVEVGGTPLESRSFHHHCWMNNLMSVGI